MTDEIKNKCYVGIRGIYTTVVLINVYPGSATANGR